MKRRLFSLALAMLLFGLNQIIGQSAATNKGSHILSGALSFTSQGGDLYSDFEDNNFNSLTLVTSYYNFVANQVGVGGDLTLNRSSQGDDSFTTFGIGPKAAYFFDTGASAIPFAGAGVNYLLVDVGDESENGYQIKLGGGMLVRKGHLGFSFEIGWMRDSFKPDGADESITGSTIFIGAGLVGFLYKDSDG